MDLTGSTSIDVSDKNETHFEITTQESTDNEKHETNETSSELEIDNETYKIKLEKTDLSESRSTNQINIHLNKEDEIIEDDKNKLENEILPIHIDHDFGEAIKEIEEPEEREEEDDDDIRTVSESTNDKHETENEEKEESIQVPETCDEGLRLDQHGKCVGRY